MTDLAKRINKTRIARGMSMSTLANLCSVSTSAVSNWENGNTVPRDESLHRLARSLGVTRNYLETGDGGDDTAMDVKSILDRAKHQISSVTGMSPDTVKLTLSIDA